MWWWCLDAGTGHTGAMVGSRTLVVPVLVQCVLWCTVHEHSGAMCPPAPGAPDWRDTRVGRRVNMYRPDLAPHGDDAADCDKRIRLFLGRTQLRGGGLGPILLAPTGIAVITFDALVTGMPTGALVAMMRHYRSGSSSTHFLRFL